ncbi:MAG: putative transcriptional regulator [Crocinitomix sp.]|jgi:predicted transcriptional regulator
MGLTKTDLFTTEQNELAVLAKCLAHPARIAILQHLLKADACINSDLVQELGLAQATISQHLKELKAIGLIKGTIDGVSMNYCINPEVWINMKSSFNEMFDKHSVCGGESCC